jgi:hypothetical protein
MKNILAFAVLMFSGINLFAQQGNTIEMADSLRSNGKIYVVVICILIILIGLIAYLFKLDNRLKKIEKKHQP